MYAYVYVLLGYALLICWALMNERSVGIQERQMTVCIMEDRHHRSLTNKSFFTRDALLINGESLGLYDIPPLQCANQFGQLLNNPELSDFVIVAADGQELHVHQVILITRWPHFRNMHVSGMMEAQHRRMEISEPYPVVLAFLKYLYSDQLAKDESWEVICDILVMANMYLLHRLKKICCQRLYECHLTIGTCTTVFEKALMAEEVGLKLLALDFMFSNYGALLKADLLHQMSNFARQEFLECIPDEAVLHVGRSRCIKTNGISQYPMNTSSSTRTTSSAIVTTPSLIMTSSSSSSSSSSASSSYDQHSSHRFTPSTTNLQQLSSSSSHTNMGTLHSALISTMRPSMTNTAVQTNDMMASSSSHQRLGSSNGMVVGV